MSAQQELSIPQHLDPKELYGLKDGEEVLYSILPNGKPAYTWEDAEEKYLRVFSPGEIDADPAVTDLFATAQKDARQIQSSPTVVDKMGMASELQGYYKDVRVVPARDIIRGHRVKGWTLIGIPRDPAAIVYGEASM
jgi:hypothetical protein